MIGNCLENVRKNVPLVHNITNYVTVNDVANVLLACGGSPIMSDEPDDVGDITSICGGLNINIGTLNKNSIEGMFIAGKKANELSHKILLDPVGAGASKLRTDTAVKLAKEIAKVSSNQGITTDVLIEVNIGREENKTGLNPDMLYELILASKKTPMPAKPISIETEEENSEK